MDLDKAESSCVDEERPLKSHYIEGSRKVRMGHAFVMKHKANRMEMRTLKQNEVW